MCGGAVNRQPGYRARNFQRWIKKNENGENIKSTEPNHNTTPQTKFIIQPNAQKSENNNKTNKRTNAERKKERKQDKKGRKKAIKKAKLKKERKKQRNKEEEIKKQNQEKERK